jgi:predicted phosphodiesterase
LLTLVQISDIHFKIDHTNINRLGKLLEDLKSELTQSEKAILILSGDIANSGDDGQYESFFNHFIAPAIDLFAGIVVCPGNHDVQRDLNEKEPMDRISAQVDRPYLYDSKGSVNLECPLPKNNLSSYEAFQELVTSPVLANFYGSSHEFANVGIVSLNTTWLSQKRERPHTDRGQLRIDPPAIEHLLKPLKAAEIKIAVMHHPLDWIAEDARQEIENLLTTNFDAVLYGHMHSPSTVSGTFVGGKCLFHQAPTTRSSESRGANAYSLIRIAIPGNHYQIKYRAYSVTQNKFVEGVDICESGVSYPTDEDRTFWKTARDTIPSEIITQFKANLPQTDFADWLQKNIPGKTKSPLLPVEPGFRRLLFVNGERRESPRTDLKSAIAELPARMYFIGPSDCGMSTAAYMALRHISSRVEEYRVVPVYINCANLSVNRASLLGEAAKTCPVPLGHRQIESLAGSGEIAFILDGISLPNTEKFNHVVETLESYFPKCKSLIFCSTDGAADGVSSQIEVKLNPSSDTIFEIEQLTTSNIRELVRLHFPEREGPSQQAIVDNIIQSFKGMDEPVYASSVVLLIDTLKQLPDFKPINRIRLLDRYVEVLLGRLDFEDIRVGTFSSTDKLALLSYLAGHFAQSNKHYLSVGDWHAFINEYATVKMFKVPSGLLDEFCSKGILFNSAGRVTFRADYLFSYFVAREMHRNSILRRFVLDGDRFFAFHREIAAYGELEGVDNRSLIEGVKARLDGIEEQVLEAYSRSGIDLDVELANLFSDPTSASKVAGLTAIAEDLTGMPPQDRPDDRHLDGELSSVDRGRGIIPRAEVRFLECRWLSTLMTYLRLLKHSENLDGIEKLKHVAAALDSGELFVKSLASKRDIIASKPAVVLDGILYLNPLAGIDNQKSRAEFCYDAPMSFGRVVREALSNPKLSPVFRELAHQGSEMRRYFIRRLLLDHSTNDNTGPYVKSLLDSTELVLQTSSLRELKRDFILESHSEPRKSFLNGIVDSVAKSQKIGTLFSKRDLEKRRLIEVMKKNAKGKDRN